MEPRSQSAYRYTGQETGHGIIGAASQFQTILADGGQWRVSVLRERNVIHANDA